jgi:hypothetical protein
MNPTAEELITERLRCPDISKTGMILWRAELKQFLAVLEVEGAPRLVGTSRTVDDAQAAIDTMRSEK